MTLPPYEKIYRTGAWHTNLAEDPLYLLRRSLMMFGLAVCIIGPLIFVYESIQNRRYGNDIMLHLGMIVAMTTFGWAGFPYWANGVFRTYIGLSPRGDFDPKPLVDSPWFIPGLWRVGVIALMYGFLLMVPVFLLLTLVFGLMHGTWKKAGATMLCLGVVAAFFFLDSNFLGWLID